MTMRPRVIRQFCDGPFGQVHVRRAGDTGNKPGLVCLHMSPKSGRSFADILPYLAGERRVLAPDNPGHGESDLPPAQPPVTLEDYARSMWAALEDSSMPPPPVVMTLLPLKDSTASSPKAPARRSPQRAPSPSAASSTNGTP